MNGKYSGLWSFMITWMIVEHVHDYIVMDGEYDDIWLIPLYLYIPLRYHWFGAQKICSLLYTGHDLRQKI
jgi:hypothetical protein